MSVEKLGALRVVDVDQVPFLRCERRPSGRRCSFGRAELRIRRSRAGALVTPPESIGGGMETAPSRVLPPRFPVLRCANRDALLRAAADFFTRFSMRASGDSATSSTTNGVKASARTMSVKVSSMAGSCVFGIRVRARRVTRNGAFGRNWGADNGPHRLLGNRWNAPPQTGLRESRRVHQHQAGVASPVAVSAARTCRRRGVSLPSSLYAAGAGDGSSPGTAGEDGKGRGHGVVRFLGRRGMGP